eukprot:4407360-Amphidinium_carterae.1
MSGRERRSAKLEVSMVAGLPPLAFGLQHGIAECMAREDHKGMSTHRQCLHLHRLEGTTMYFKLHSLELWPP